MSTSLQPLGLYSPWNSLGQNTRMCSLSLLQGIFPTQGSNSGLPHCRQILYQLSYQRSPLNKKLLTNLLSKDVCCGRGSGKTLYCNKVYNSLAKTNEGGTHHPPSDVCVRSFFCPFFTLIKLCYTKALEWSSLVPGPKAKSLEIINPTSFTISYQWGDHESDIVTISYQWVSSCYMESHW